MNIHRLYKLIFLFLSISCYGEPPLLLYGGDYNNSFVRGSRKDSEHLDIKAKQTRMVVSYPVGTSRKGEFREWRNLRNKTIYARMVSVNEGDGVVGLEKEGTSLRFPP